MIRKVIVGVTLWLFLLFLGILFPELAQDLADDWDVGL